MPTALLVEEHDEMRAALRDWLLSASLPPLRLLEARSLEEALRHAEQMAIGFALVNAELRGADGGRTGIEAVRELRKRYRSLPLIIMSLHDSAPLRRAALQAGADAFVTKRELRNALRPILQRLLAEL